MGIKEEFEKAFSVWLDNWDNRGNYPISKETALWAAKWMAERCAKISYHHTSVSDWEYYKQNNYTGEQIASSIRQLAKELS